MKTLDITWFKNCGHLMPDEPLNNHNTWKIGGPCDLMVEPESEPQIVECVKQCSSNNIPLLVLGYGSNLLFDDAGFRGVILKLNWRFSSYEIKGNEVRADAGLWMPILAKNTATQGLSGLEHTIGIPGSVGGLAFMNGGSLRQNIGEKIVTVRTVDLKTAKIRIYQNHECNFSYRSSIFQSKNEIVTGITLKLEPSDPSLVRTRMMEILAERRQKFPLKMPNCGSVFSSGEELHKKLGPPGKILDEMGLKGMSIGDAMVSHEHANFIINQKNATSKDVIHLISRLRSKVKITHGVDLECEVRYVHPQGKIMPTHEVA
jgi:UDP-N-acetylmuramate dehydrogenase